MCIRDRDEVDETEHEPSFGIIHQSEGVDLLPANIDLSAFEVELINSMSREYVMKNYLERIKYYYDYILIDCMPSLGVLTINALVAADSVIISSQPNFLSTKGINQLFHSISWVDVYKRQETVRDKFKLIRAQRECLGIGSRRRTWQAAKSCGELQISKDPQISEWGNPYGEEP